MKRLVAGKVVSRNRDDFKAGLQMVASGRHRMFFESDVSHVLIVRVLHERMDYRRHLEVDEDAD